MTGLVEARRRGQPLVALGLLLAGWIGLRALLWEAPGRPAAQAVLPATASRPGIAPVQPAPSAPARPVIAPIARSGWSIAVRPQVTSGFTGSPAAPPAPLAPVDPPAGRGLPPGPDQVRLIEGHQIAWGAGLAHLSPPPVQSGRSGAALPLAADRDALHRSKPQDQRWSGAGWLLLRHGGGTAAGGQLLPGYGASQAGGVLRYRLAPASSLRPALYLRATSPLAAPRGEEAALGLMLRPARQVPVALMGEVRVTNQAQSAVLRPAASLVSEIDPVALPGGWRAEVYGQGGYVGGRNGTAFADGKLRIDRAVGRLDRAELRVGGGIWGGAQRGAGRLDLGPAATIQFPLGRGQGRIAADWRLRVAGGAVPQSGPALTLSAGF